MPYAIAELRFDGRDAPHHIREGAWRSVLNSQHGFFQESFIDGLAHAAGTDPYAFRRDLMDGHPRFRAVLDRVAEMADWGSSLPAGEGRGIAESFGTIVGQVAGVAVSPQGSPAVIYLGHRGRWRNFMTGLHARFSVVAAGSFICLIAAWAADPLMAQGLESIVATTIGCRVESCERAF